MWLAPGTEQALNKWSLPYVIIILKKPKTNKQPKPIQKPNDNEVSYKTTHVYTILWTLLSRILIYVVPVALKKKQNQNKSHT